jgi:chromosomal replication initiation ATPase DnaA
MKTSGLIELRVFTKKTLEELLERIDDAIDVAMKNEGSVAMYAGMTTKEKMDYVIDEICRYGDVTFDKICSGKKYQKYVKWAKISCYILSDYLHVSLWDIAERLNYRNHFSVINHRNTIRGFMECDDKFNDITFSTKEILKRLGL